MRETGKLHIVKTKKGKINVSIIKDSNGKSSPFYIILKDTTLDGKPCEFELNDKGQIARAWVEGQELTGQAPVRKEKPKPRSGSQPYTKSGTVQHAKRSMPRQAPPADSFDLQKTCLPKDTRDLPLRDIDNFYLKLNKAARLEGNIHRLSDKSKFVFFHKGKNTIDFQIQANFNADLIEALQQRQQSVIDTISQPTVTFSAKPQWRWIVGLGHESVYETSMSLHFTYGIPVIPASSLKGITRSWMIEEHFAGEEDQALQDSLFRFLFGHEPQGEIAAHQGNIQFFDAYPAEVPEVSVDIMNPHYGPYYSGQAAPLDSHNPVPVPFLTISKGIFSFALALQTAEAPSFPDSKFSSQSPLEFAKTTLIDALQHHGIGAKTAIGYGVLEKQ